MAQQENTYLTKLEEAQAAVLAVKFVVNNGGEWDETTSRIHCVDVIYRDNRYIQQKIRKWAGSMSDAYELAKAAWLAEREAGRTAI